MSLIEDEDTNLEMNEESVEKNNVDVAASVLNSSEGWTKTWIEVLIQHSDGSDYCSFDGEEWKSFVQMAEQSDKEIPCSCRSWACFVCACEIVSWIEHVDIAKLSVPLVDVEDNQVLSCIWWIKKECFSDGKFHKIVLRKLL